MKTKLGPLFAVLLFFIAAPPARSAGHSPDSFNENTAVSSGEVEIFITSWCPYCKKLENFLKERSIHYTRHDIERDGEASALFSKLGGSGVPLTRISNQWVIHGYDPEGILEALKVKKK